MKFQVAAALLAAVSLNINVNVNVEAYSFTPRSAFGLGVGKTRTRTGSRNERLLSGRSPPSPSSSSSSSSSPLVMKESTDGKFSISSLFGSSSKAKKAAGGEAGSLFASSATATLEPHPSARHHISPLNQMAPDKLAATITAANSNTETDSDADSTSLLPVHQNIHTGVLDNGLSYVILPNKTPAGRFEAHLQVFSGSADELQPQQGIAHLTEHVAYMGSRKRERLFGTGSQTNAYTDFHHTVFYAACPTYKPSANPNAKSQVPMLPMALDALCDVMEARVEPSRLEKERAAVLSEMTMVNTIEYRVECQILATLHRENRLAKRFPIGKENLIRTWQTDDVKTWHRTHYRPDNVLLYIVGDVDPADARQVIQDKFGHITAEKQGAEIRLEELKPEASKLADAIVNSKNVIKSAQSWHYPPVVHEWGSGSNAKLEADFSASLEEEQTNKALYDLQLQDSYDMDEKVEFLKATELEGGKKVRPHIFRHELLQAFSLHLFAKRPVEPIVDMESFRRSLARRVALAALQIRLNVGGRSDDPAFTFVEFNQLDSAREGCSICSLDMTSEPSRWKEAVCKSISEVRKLGIHGVTPSEMERYASALMTDAEQLAAQGDLISNGDQLSYLMETVANGHTFMSPEQSYEITGRALSELTLEEVNQAAKDLCSHVTSIHADEPADNGVLIVTACSPKGADPGSEEYCDEEGLLQTLYEACQIDVQPEEDLIVPQSLVSQEDLEEAIVQTNPSWKQGRFSDGTPPTPHDKLTRPFTLRRLSNGIRIGIGQNPAESQRGHLRITAPGGRHAEKVLGLKPGSMAVGSRAMQEGGAFGPWTREQVELFCVDHLLMVEINCNEESLNIDFVFPTTNVGNIGFGDDIQLGITGTESVLQIVREIIVGFHWEEDALGRSKQSFRSSHESLQKNLEGKSTEEIMEAMTGHDARFLSTDVETVNAVTLDDAKSAIMSQLLPRNLEISAAGDFDVQEVLDMILKYIGTIPKDANAEYDLEKDAGSGSDDGADADSAVDTDSTEAEVVVAKDFGGVPILDTPGKFLELELTDPDPRAVSYVAGSAPNMWGTLADGTTVAERVMAADKSQTDYDKRRRQHPLYANVSLSLLSEIINRRLFSNVRERKQLTYDANFSLTGFERLGGGWFLVTVTASKENAQKALEACKETLETLRKTNKITADNLESAKRVLINRYSGELRSSKFWTTIMSGIQEESIPLKGPLSVTDYKAVVEAITVKDLQFTLECLGLDDSELYTAIGRTVVPEGYVPDEEIVKASPMAGMGRGGALMN